ncbi:methyltransferase domain-containing protein [Streptomyces sp. URMC 127]|uniref:methyltransferase domain-containing protein n=1 Tax=Streptomyces sp. URMC 127 TaxID=3423402 RepID=UPI003F1A848C
MTSDTRLLCEPADHEAEAPGTPASPLSEVGQTLRTGAGRPSVSWPDMADHCVPHAFSDLDAHSDPSRLVTTLNRLSDDPFFASYKQRLHELLRARPGRRILDAGAGTGEAALRLAGASGAAVTACDLSAVMCREMRRNGLPRVAVADAHHLPFRDRVFDGVLADRVLQHVNDPGKAVTELLRVTRPGGRIVVCDPDTGTQALALEDEDLAEKVLSLRRTKNIRNGTFARTVPGLFADHGLEDIHAEARTLLIRDPESVDGTMGIRDWAGAFADRGYLGRAEADRFNALLDKAIGNDRFLYAVTYFLTAATVPGNPGGSTL